MTARYDLAIVSCGASKTATAQPARALYTSTLFRLSLAHAEAHARHVLIASAKHGLVEPSAVLEPYDLTLREVAEGPALAWATWLGQVHRALPAAPGRAVVLAGSYYLSALLPVLVRERGWTVEAPLAGKTIGRRLQWLACAQRAAA